jgi:predicted Zn-dependent protease
VLCLAALCSILAAAACFGGERKDRDPDQIGHRNVAAGVNLYSRDREMEMGKELAADVTLESQMINDPIISEYINRIGQNLVNNSDADFPVTIRVIRSQDVNAFALPGGYVFVNSALIRASETEAELAGALAHEIGHVAARHYTREESLRDIISMAGIPLLFVGGVPAFAVEQGLQVAGPLAAMKFSRSAEKQADLLGVQYLYRAGYDPVALVDFLERISVLRKSDPSVFSKMFSMHPAAASRIRTLEGEIQHDLRPRDQYVIQTSEFQGIQKRLAAIEDGVYVPWRFPRSPMDGTRARPTLRRSPGQYHDPSEN